MFLTKIAVLVASETKPDADDLCARIEYNLGREMEEGRQSGVFVEVRDYGTKEVTLGSIDVSLEDGSLPEATRSQAEQPAATATRQG